MHKINNKKKSRYRKIVKFKRIKLLMALLDSVNLEKKWKNKVIKKNLHIINKLKNKPNEKFHKK